MAKRKVKSLENTGRISRSKASATAVSLRAHGKMAGKSVILKSLKATSTASGKGQISFHVKGKLTDKKSSGSSVSAKKTA